jgi:hypothetical protein
MPAVGVLIEDFCDRVSDLGLPVSEDGMKMCEHIDKEMNKRDQEEKMMHICNDWNGWGMGEVMENLVSSRDRGARIEETGCLSDKIIAERFQSRYFQEDNKSIQKVRIHRRTRHVCHRSRTCMVDGQRGRQRCQSCIRVSWCYDLDCF